MADGAASKGRPLSDGLTEKDIIRNGETNSQGERNNSDVK